MGLHIAGVVVYGGVLFTSKNRYSRLMEHLCSPPHEVSREYEVLLIARNLNLGILSLLSMRESELRRLVDACLFSITQEILRIENEGKRAGSSYSELREEFAQKHRLFLKYELAGEDWGYYFRKAEMLLSRPLES